VTSLYYLGNFRTDEQLASMRQLEADGVCIFCPEHLSRNPRAVHRSAHWTVVPNAFPYRGTRLHYLLVPAEHVTDMVDLSPAAQQDFWAALTWARDEHQLTAYGLAARNGECEYTGGTIRHLHIHLLQGDPEQESVRVKLSSAPPLDVDPDQLDPGRA
jgi:diadenosine tetraphosphate (Ap4A) HIT family hydrolase